MKKWITMILVISSAVCVQAARGDSTKDQFFADSKKQSEGKPWSFDQAKAEQTFNAIDTNHDGIASGVEKSAYWSSKEGKAKIVPTPAMKKAVKSVVKKGKFDWTRDEFMADRKVEGLKKGWKWDQVKMDAMFTAIDADHDGVATGQERKDYWAKKAK